MGLRTLFKKWFKIEQKRMLKEWNMKGKPAPPPHIVKQMAIAQYKKRFNLDALVETGTYLGEMVEAHRKKFRNIYSIELDHALYSQAVKKFEKYKHIQLYQGDSGEVLQKLIKTIQAPTLFWLDGHYSAGNTAKGDLNTPIMKELKCILETNLDHVILIDDAREFIGKNDYPTIEQVKDFVQKQSPNYKMEVKDDIIRLYK